MDTSKDLSCRTSRKRRRRASFVDMRRGYGGAALISLLSLPLCACHVVSYLLPSSGVAHALAMPSIPFRPVAYGEKLNTKVVKPINRVIKSQNEFNVLVPTHTYPCRPSINFSDELAVFVHLGELGSDEIGSVEIVGVEETPDKLIVHSIKWQSTGFITINPRGEVYYPWFAVAIPRTDKPIEFAPLERANIRFRPHDRTWPTDENRLKDPCP